MFSCSPRVCMFRKRSVLLLGATVSSILDFYFRKAQAQSTQNNIRKIGNEICPTSSLSNTTSGGGGEYDVAIIGGGVVGLAVAMTLASTMKELRVVVLEKEDSIAAGASSGNSGIGCTGYDAPVGSLERQLLRRSIRLHPSLYRSFGLNAGEHVRKSGSLVVAWTQEEEDKLPGILRENQLAGDEDARLLTREQLREEAPELSSEARGGVFCPHEAVVEPWLVPVGFAIRARSLGVQILTGRKVTSIRRSTIAGSDGDDHKDNSDDNTNSHREERWVVQTQETARPELCSSGRSKRGSLLVQGVCAGESTGADDAQVGEEGSSQTQEVSARVVINCAGLFGDEIEKMRMRALRDKSEGCDVEVASPPPPFTVTPRKGQFAVFRPKSDIPTLPPASAIVPGTRLLSTDTEDTTTGDVAWLAPTMIIEPVPTERTKGVILWKTVYGTVIVGPTADDQEAKDDRSTDSATLQRLMEHGRRVMPALQHWELIGSYSGLRPATEHRDYQIHASRKQHWVYVGGIRSTGLTAATGIGEYVVQTLLEENLLDLTRAGEHKGSVASSATVSGCADDMMGVSQSAASVLPLSSSPFSSPEPLSRSSFQFPSLAQMSEDYLRSNSKNDDDCDDSENDHNHSVEKYLVFDGFKYRVTHPISSFGMENYQYIARIHDERKKAGNES